MSYIEVIFSSRLFIAILLHSALIILGIIIFEYLHGRYQNSFLDLLWETVGMPLYRTVIIVVFVFVSYPLIFGLHEAPALVELMASSHSNVMTVINVLFIISLIFPWIPLIGKHPGLIMPLQAIICCTLVFSWLADFYQLQAYNDVPGFSTVMLIIALAIITYYLANWLAHEFGAKLDERLQLEGCQQLIAPSIILFLQIPAILIYSLSLGRQLQPLLQ